MPSHMLQTRIFSRPLDRTPTAQALALLVRPLINTALRRAPFLLLNHMHRLLSPLPIRMPHLRTLSHRLSHMSHPWALFCLRLPNLRRLPRLCSRIQLNPPHSLYQHPLLHCPHVARHMHLHLHPLSPCHPSLYSSPRATLILPLPLRSLLSASRIYQIPTYLGATRLPSLCHQALLTRNSPAPMQTRSRCRRIPLPPPRRRWRPVEATRGEGEAKAEMRLKTSARHASGSAGKRRARAHVVSRRRRMKSWRGRSIRSLTWLRSRMNLAAPRTRSYRVSPREL